MQLPKYKKKNRRKLKICQEPGCGREFWGHPIAKYCELHRDLKTRKRARRVYENVDVKNQIFKHNFSESSDIEFTCQLEGCSNKFFLKVFPKQFVYPKYCPEHRNEYKREAHLRRWLSKKSA